MKLVGASPASKIAGINELPGKSNYFIGNDPHKWRSNIPMYAKVKYQDIYSGIDVLYYGNQQQLETDFVVRRGANPNRIALCFQGAKKMEVQGQGDLTARTAAGEVRLRKPFIYQEVNGLRREIPGGYLLRALNPKSENPEYEVGFKVGAYDRTKTLVIDPVLLAYSTLLGGSGLSDVVSAVAVDAAGNAYVVGETDSSDFPTTPGAFQTQTTPPSSFVTKLNPAGTGLVYSTYFGLAPIWGIAVDAGGNVFFTGYAGEGLPTTEGAYQTTHQGTFYYGSNNQFSYPCHRAFVTKLNPTGDKLLYSTYLGGNTDNTEELGAEVAVDATGNAYVTGSTSSIDFPTTPGAFQPTRKGETDAFVTKLNAAGSGLVYSTYFGGATVPWGSGSSTGLGIGADLSGNIYVAGRTATTDLPVTPGAYQTANAGDIDVFVAKFDPTREGSASLLYSTYLGGGGADSPGNFYPFGGNSLAVDDTGKAYVTGVSWSGPSFPTTPQAFSHDGQMFVAKIDPTLSGNASLVYAAKFGGGEVDLGNSIAVDHVGTVFVTGGTEGFHQNTVNAFQPTVGGGTSCGFGGSADAFVLRVNPGGTRLVYFSYLGKGDNDAGTGIAVDSIGNAYLAGWTGGLGCSNAGFPTTPGAFQTGHAGDNQKVGFVAKVVDAGQASGSGGIDVAGGTGTFDFSVQRDTTGALTGALQYVNQVTGAKAHAEKVTGLVIDGQTATFTGTCTTNAAPCTFAVSVTDNGSPGTNDSFSISVSGGSAEGGTLRNGDIQIQH